MKLLNNMDRERYCYFVKMAVCQLSIEVIQARYSGQKKDFTEELDELHDLMMDRRLQECSFSIHLDYVMGKLRNWKVADMTALGRILSLVGDVDIEAERSF